MMRCARAQEELSAFLDEELTAQKMAELRAHLEGCAECRAELDALRRTVDSVRALPRTAAPAGFRDGVMAKLKKAPAQPAEVVRAPLWRKLWPVAAAIAFALLIRFFYPTTQPADQRSRNVALRSERAARDTEFDKFQPAVDAVAERVMGKGAPSAPAPVAGGEVIGKGGATVALREDSAGLLAKGPEPGKGFVDNRNQDFAPAREERPGVVAEGKAIGKGDATVALKKDSEQLLAKGEEPPRNIATNALENYSIPQQPVVADQAKSGAVAQAEHPGIVAEGKAIGKGDAPVALQKDGERLLAKAPADFKGSMYNVAEGYAPQQPALLDQAKSGAGAPVEIVIASADPDRARQVARELLAKRGWLAQEEASLPRGAGMAKVAAVPPRTIQLNLPPDQLAALRQELTQAGLTMLPAPTMAAQRDQAVQSLTAAVRLEEEKQRAAAQAAPPAAVAQQMAQQRSPEPAARQQGPPRIQQDSLGGQGAATVRVLLRFVAAEPPPTQNADINQAAPNPPPMQGK